MRKTGDLSLLFTTSDGRLVNTHDLYFDADVSFDYVKVENFEFKIKFTLPSAGGGSIIRHFTFRNGEYGFETGVTLQNLSNVIANFEYQLVWESGIRYAEHNSVDESGFAAAYAYAGKELTHLDAPNVGEHVQRDVSGAVEWVATRNKYFALAIMPQSPRKRRRFS